MLMKRGEQRVRDWPRRWPGPVLRFLRTSLCILFWALGALSPASAQTRWDEHPAEYPGGEVAMHHFLVDNMHYPPTAEKEGIRGRVFVKIEIDSAGAVAKAAVAKGIGGGCEEEALRVVQAMPRFKPATINGIPTKSWLLVPIHFPDTTVSNYTETMPEFPGGNGKISAFITKNLHLPKHCTDLPSRLYTEFVVTTTGHIVRPRVVPPSGCPALDRELVRRISKLPPFIPGRRHNGEPVAIRYRLPIACLRWR